MPLPLLIYDANCPMCRRAQGWLASHSRPGALEFVGCQTEERTRRAPQVREEQCLEAMQLVLPEGHVFAATDAFERVLPLLRAPWCYLAVLFHVPGARVFARPAYRWIARNRMALSGLIEKKAPGERCDLDGGCR